MDIEKFLSEVISEDKVNELIEGTDFHEIDFDYNREIDYFLCKLKESLKADSISSVNRSLRLWKMIYLLKLGQCIVKNKEELNMLEGWDKIIK